MEQFKFCATSTQAPLGKHFAANLFRFEVRASRRERHLPVALAGAGANDFVEEAWHRSWRKLIKCSNLIKKAVPNLEG